MNPLIKNLERDELSSLASFYSDMHKDTYGFRPRSNLPTTVEGYRKAIDDLSPILEEEIERENRERQERLVEFCERVRAMCDEHNIDPFTACRWMMDAINTDFEWEQDIDYFFFSTGMPYAQYSQLAHWFALEYRKGRR